LQNPGTELHLLLSILGFIARMDRSGSVQ